MPRKRSVVLERRLQLPVLVTLLDRGEKVLAAVLHPFHRAAEPEPGGRDRDLFGIHDELGAEAAADVGRDHANLVLVEPEQPHQERADLVGELGRCPERQPILVRVVGRQHAAAFDRMGAAAMLLQADADAVRRAAESGGDIAVGLLDLRHHVALAAAVRERRARRQRAARQSDTAGSGS